MNAEELDKTLRRSGFMLSVLDTNNLKLVGPKMRLTPELIATIKSRKSELLAFLKKKHGKHPPTSPSITSDIDKTGCNASGMSVYRVVISGVPITLITPSKESPDEIMERLGKQFYQYEVTDIQPSPFTTQKEAAL